MDQAAIDYAVDKFVSRLEENNYRSEILRLFPPSIAVSASGGWTAVYHSHNALEPTSIRGYGDNPQKALDSYVQAFRHNDGVSDNRGRK